MSDGVASLINEDGEVKADALSVLLSKDKEKVETLKGDKKSSFDDGYKKATSEILSKRDKELKEAYGLSSDSKGIDLVKEIIASNTKSVEGGDVTKSREYIEMVEQKDKESLEALQELQSKWDAEKLEIERERTFSEVGNKALSILEELNPILSADAVKAGNQRKLFIDLVKSASNYRVSDLGIEVLDNEGNIKQTEHGHRVKFTDHVISVANGIFDFHVSKPKGQPNIPEQGGSIYTISSEADFIQKMKEAKTPEDRRALSEAYEKLKK